jgi:aldose 1-epimerase
MLTLEAAGWRALLLPEQGAAFAALEHRGVAVLEPLAGRNPNATPAGAFWMVPWTNRLDGGLFPWAGQRYVFPITHPREGNALHGLARAMPWHVERSGPAHAVLTQRLRQLPFDYAARLEISLGEGGLDMALHLEQVGEASCPLGFGWHPWFARPPGCVLRFSAAHKLQCDARKLPIGAEPCIGVEGGEDIWLGTDGHYPGWNGVAVLQRPDATVTLEATGDWAHNLQFYAPAEHPVLCLEPVSHVPDVINRPALAPFGPMRVLARGETLEGRIHLGIG